MKDTVFTIILTLLPKKTFSRWAGRFARSAWSRHLIPLYVRTYGIDVSLAEKPPGQYRSLAEFFTRRLKPHLRPVDPREDSVVSPVDGTVSQTGVIARGTMIQAKGITYTAAGLLGSDEAAHRFEGGTFLVIYLSPRDYHRIHAPLTGAVTSYTYIPGTLYPVNEWGVRKVKGLYARNERLITYMDTAAGLLALVKVGAMIVGSVKVAYHEPLGTNIPRVRRGEIQTAPVNPPAWIRKGEELGRFEFGSTVILLFEPGRVRLADHVHIGSAVQMGQRVASLLS